MSKIKYLITNKDSKPYRLESELCNRVDILIHEYDGILSSVAVAGILELMKLDVLGRVNE